MELGKIVVGVDFSAESDLAVKHTVDIARRAGAEIVLVHVCPVAEAPDNVAGEQTEWHKFMRRQLAANRERLEDMRTSLRGQSVEVSHVVIDAAPADGLLQSAEELSADLIAVGTHGYTGIDRLLLGSVAERVIRHGKKSTLVVRGELHPSGGYRRVLVPTDFSPSAREAVACATAMVAKGGSVEVRHYWHTPVFGPVPDPSELQQAAERSTSQRGAELLEVHEHSEEYDMKFSAGHGNPKREVLELLDKGAYDLVVMGSHGRQGLSRLLLGSVAETVTRHAPCSVMVVKKLQEG